MLGEQNPGPLAARFGVRLFVGLYVVLQVTLPLSYYLGHPLFGERFTWRMFSKERLTPCEVTLEEPGGAPSLVQRFHVGWVQAMTRGVFPVMEKALVARCAEGRAWSALRRRCRALGDDVETVEWLHRDCATGTLTLRAPP